MKKNTDPVLNEDGGKSLKKQLASVVFFKKRRLKSKEESRETGTATAIALFGVVGWSIVVPLALFIIIGQFIINKFDLGQGVILNFIVFGFAIGIYNTTKEVKKAINRGFKKKSKK